jgi:hypothetical protein
VVKDVLRVEELVLGGWTDRGSVIVLTNDPSYWSRSDRRTFDADFR